MMGPVCPPTIYHGTVLASSALYSSASAPAAGQLNWTNSHGLRVGGLEHLDVMHMDPLPARHTRQRTQDTVHPKTRPTPATRSDWL